MTFIRHALSSYLRRSGNEAFLAGNDGWSLVFAILYADLGTQLGQRRKALNFFVNIFDKKTYIWYKLYVVYSIRKLIL